MRAGPKSSLKPFLHLALQLIKRVLEVLKYNLKQNSNVPKSFSQLSSC